jgi:hypothetical protein
MQQTKPGTDEYAGMIDAGAALDIGVAGTAAAFHGHHRSRQHP